MSSRISKNIKVTSSARPGRVCYVVNVSEECDEILDAVFAESYSRWGGKHTLVVPLIQGGISEKYLKWVSRFDPDLVYLCTVITDDALRAIEQVCNPAVIHGWTKEAPPYGLHWDVKYLHCFSVLPALKMTGLGYQSKPRLIVDAYPGWETDRFVTDNFGTRRGSCGATNAWPIAEQLKEFVGSVAFHPQGGAAHFRHMQAADEELASASQLLERMTADAAIITMSLLSAAFAEARIEHRAHPWSSTFNLVVGKRPLERISFWNSRLNYEQWLQTGVTALCVPHEYLADDTFVDRLGTFLQRRNAVRHGGGTGGVTVRASSVDDDCVQKLRAALQKKFVVATIERLDTYDDCVPADESIEHLNYDSKKTSAQFVDTREFTLADSLPSHMTDYGTVPPHAAVGGWIVDVKIERHSTVSAFGRDQHWWKLPRRPAAYHAFFAGSNGRVDRFGRLSVARAESRAAINLKIPRDRDLIAALLHRDRPWFQGDDIRQKRPASGVYDHVQRSDKGVYLNAAIRIFGSLAHAFSVFANPFWTQMFSEMAFPAHNSSETVQTQIAQRLRNRLAASSGSVTIATQDDWASLADATGRVAIALKKPRLFRSYDEFLKGYLDFIGKTRKAEHPPASEQDLEAELRRGLTRRCAEKVLTQGRHWKCRKCGYRNWTSLAQMAPAVPCVICGVDATTPANFAWHFYLNELLAEGLREHGLLGPLMCLGELQMKSTESFYYVPCVDLYEGYPEQPDAKKSEIDVCCVVDGKLVIGEAKLQVRDFSKAELDKLSYVANAVRPDRVILCCLENSPVALSKLDRSVQKVRQALTYADATVEALIPKGGLWRGVPYLT